MTTNAGKPTAVIGETIDSARAWLTVAAGFLACFILVGVANSFGAYFKPMAQEFGARLEATSAIFSITAALYFALSALTGYLSDHFGLPSSTTGYICTAAPPPPPPPACLGSPIEAEGLGLLAGSGFVGGAQIGGVWGSIIGGTITTFWAAALWANNDVACQQ